MTGIEKLEMIIKYGHCGLIKCEECPNDPDNDGKCVNRWTDNSGKCFTHWADKEKLDLKAERSNIFKNSIIWRLPHGKQA